MSAPDAAVPADTTADVCQKCQVHPVSGTVYRTRCICPSPMTPEETLRGVAGLSGDIGDAVRDLLAEVESLRAMERRAEELHNEPRRGTDSWERGRYDAADYILTGKTS